MRPQYGYVRAAVMAAVISAFAACSADSPLGPTADSTNDSSTASAGRPAKAQRNPEVNTAPTATIIAPADGVTVAQDASVTFTGSASDLESGALTGASLVWTSSRDGQIGTGTSFSKTNLTVGTHTITMTARDPQNAVGTAKRTITVNATITPPTITPPVSGGGGTEPTGMTKLAENDFSCFSSCGNGWYYGQDYANASQVIQDALAPRSGGNVVQQNYTPSLVPGSSPASIGTGLSAKQTVYTSIWMKMSDNYLGHGSGVNKVLHFYTASRTGGSNIAVFLLRGTGNGTLVPSFGMQNLAAPYHWNEPNGTAHFETVANLDPNLAACSVTRGRWTRYEMVLTSNTPGLADGRVELWMDGTKCIDYTGITYAATGTDSRWNELNWSPTYGGAGGTITSSFFTQVDHIYVSGK